MIAPFFSGAPAERWIDDFVAGADYRFQKVPFPASRDDWHSRSRRATGAANWAYYWSQSRHAFPAAGLITVFPQAALMASVQKQLRLSDVPLLAWCFNLGQYPTGMKRAAARAALKAVDRFVVHSTAEIGRVAEFLGMPEQKITFVPLQRAPIAISASEDIDEPFIASLGSANRDYRTLFLAAEISGLPCKVVASPRSIEGLRIPPNVSVEQGLTSSQCHHVVQRSRFSVVPLLDPTIASGQVTVVESMRMNKPVIATESIGTVDYIVEGRSGTLVRPHDPEALADAMLRLWEDARLRRSFTREAADFAATSLSDEAAGAALGSILDELKASR